ncbi:MAG: type II CAAX prenyl endopeptidase Rce1 family protein [Acidimicrobiales bacterium]
MDWDHIALWRCDCGYVNAGSGRCAACGSRHPDRPAPAPGGLRALALPEPVDDAWAGAAADAWARRRGPSSRAGSGAGRTVAGTIVLNVVLQVAAIASSQGMETGPAIRLSLVAGVAFYGLCALWVLARSTVLGVRPVARIGRVAPALAEGAVVGAGLAVVLVAGLRLAAGHPVLDPVTGLLTSSGPAALILGTVVLVLLGPLVEELVFRGFLAEALRPHGARFALVVSAAAFSVAHLRFAQFRYYAAMGGWCSASSTGTGAWWGRWPPMPASTACC